MKKLLLFFLFASQLLFPSIGQLPEDILKQLESEVNAEKKADLYFKLALSYEKEQEEEKAIYAFLEALNRLPSSNTTSMSEEEALLVKEAQELYLDLAYQKPLKIAEVLQDQYLEVVSRHPDYVRLNYYLAVASANLGDFADFFERFYQSYKQDSDNFLAHRTRGILHLKLWERAVESEEREKHRQAILSYLGKAMEKNPGDSTVYKFLLIMEEPAQQQDVLRNCLPRLLKQNAPIPRGDLQFFIAEAMAIKEYNLAQQLINKGKDWYEYSHMLTEAQDTLNREQGQR
jgi:tetratricopeptide (TPR) repeat protein